jgi:hypothetical protein
VDAVVEEISPLALAASEAVEAGSLIVAFTYDFDRYVLHDS